MSEHILPDDSSRWPSDPFELLGVPRNVTELDLKRAYTKLIRKYKPEHAPDEFRKIREAYEAAIEMSRWYRNSPVFDERRAETPFTPVEPQEETRDTPAETPIDREPIVDRPVRPSVVDPVEIAWGMAISGDWAAAYAELLQLTQSFPQREDIPLRLYWLLALRPTLDDTRTRHDWLAEALFRSQCSGPAMELYQRELLSDATTALYGPYLNIFERFVRYPDQMLSFVLLRLDIAATEKFWSVVDLDLAMLVPHQHDFEESRWLHYLISICQWSVFEKGQTYSTCQGLLSEMKHLELRYSWMFDRLDELTHLASLFRSQTIFIESIQWLLAVALVSESGWRRLMPKVLALVAADPTNSLHRLSDANSHRSSQWIVERFEQLVMHYRTEQLASAPRASDFPSALILGLFAVRFPKYERPDYSLMRAELLGFMIAEGLDPDEVVNACFRDSDATTRTIMERLRSDSVLRVVCRAAILAN